MAVVFAGSLVVSAPSGSAQGARMAVVPLTSEAESGDSAPPSWTMLPPSHRAYGIRVKTLNSTDDVPTFVIYGSTGSTRETRLDNGAENFVSGKYDYFVYPASNTTDVGIPIAIEFKAGGSDGWAFNDVSIDYIVSDGTWPILGSDLGTVLQGLKDRNSRWGVLHSPFGGLSLHGARALATVEFPSPDVGIDSEPETATVNGYPLSFTASHTLTAAGSELGSGTPLTVPIGAQMIVIDNRNQSEHYRWESSQNVSVSSEDVESALNRMERQAGVSYTYTVATEAEANAGVKKGKFSTSQSFTVNASIANTDESSSSSSQGSTFSSSNGGTWMIPPGAVAFFHMSIYANVTKYSTFANLNRVNSNVTPSYRIRPAFFFTDCNTGRLRLLSVAPGQTSGSLSSLNEDMQYVLGDHLDDPSQSHYLSVVSGDGGPWPDFRARSSTENTPKCASSERPFTREVFGSE